MSESKKYPDGTKFGNYYLVLSEGKYLIRRQVTLPDGERVFPRLPKSQYGHLNTKEELEQFVNRLNHRENERVKRAIEIRTSFIPTSLLEEFRAQLQAEIPNEKDFRYLYNTVFKAYFLNYFISSIKVLDPNEWYRNQSRWGLALMGKADDDDHNVFKDEKGKTVSRSIKTINQVVQIANRFMAFLHMKNPEEYKKWAFEPVTKGARKEYEAKFQLKNKGDDIDGKGRYIPEKIWKKIDKELPDDIGPFIRLMYYYGLRRSESLGFDNTDYVKKGYLRVTQQITGYRNEEARYGPLKDREKRETPHWFCKPDKAYELIEAGLNRKMHADTLYEKWTKFMKRKDIKMDWDLHDIRRTFITNALRLQNPRDVQLAVGHASLSTTMGYAQDDRDQSDETFKPNRAS